MIKRLSGCFVALTLLLALQGGHAQTYIVNWNGEYLDQKAGGQKLDLGSETPLNAADGSNEGVGFAYSEELPKSPSIAKYDAQKPSAVFYGALEFINPGASEDMATALRPLNTVVKAANTTFIGFGGTPPPDAGTSRVRGLVFWLKKDFLNGFEKMEKITWQSILSMSLNITKIDAKLSHARFAVQSGGKWYLSESASENSKAFTINDASWGEWNVTSALPLPALPDSFPTSGDQLSDITAFGFYFDAGSVSKANAVFATDAFQVEANSAPHK